MFNPNSIKKKNSAHTPWGSPLLKQNLWNLGLRGIVAQQKICFPYIFYSNSIVLSLYLTMPCQNAYQLTDDNIYCKSWSFNRKNMHRWKASVPSSNSTMKISQVVEMWLEMRGVCLRKSCHLSPLIESTSKFENHCRAFVNDNKGKKKNSNKRRRWERGGEREICDWW